MRNPFRPRPSSRRQGSTCQIIHVGRADQQTLVVDLVTVAPAAPGAQHAPAGTPMALDFGQPLDVNRLTTALLLSRWEREGAIIDLTIDDDPDGLRYDLSCGDDHLSVVVSPRASAPSQEDRP